MTMCRIPSIIRLDDCVPSYSVVETRVGTFGTAASITVTMVLGRE